MKYILSCFVTVLVVSGQFLPSARAEGRDISQGELSRSLIANLIERYASQQDLDDSSKLDLAFGVESGLLRVNFQSEDLICKVLVPSSNGWTLNYGQTEKNNGEEALVIARQYANALVIGEDVATVTGGFKVLGRIASISSKSNIHTWKDIGYDVVLAKVKFSGGVSVIKGSSLRCK